MNFALPAIDLILDSMLDCRPIAGSVVADAAYLKGISSDEAVRRYHRLEDWIFKNGYESSVQEGKVIYKKGA